MIQRCWLICVALIFLLPSGLHAQTNKKAAVLPFRINAQEDLSYLSTEIPRLIQNDLKREGASIVEPSPADIMAWKNTPSEEMEARRIGLKEGIDIVVWGSLTRIGQKISLDVKVMAPFTREQTQTLYRTMEGIENLLVNVQEVTRDIGFKLFDRAMIAEILIQGNRRIEVDAIDFDASRPSRAMPISPAVSRMI